MFDVPQTYTKMKPIPLTLRVKWQAENLLLYLQHSKKLNFQTSFHDLEAIYVDKIIQTDPDVPFHHIFCYFKARKALLPADEASPDTFSFQLVRVNRIIQVPLEDYMSNLTISSDANNLKTVNQNTIKRKTRRTRARNKNKQPGNDSPGSSSGTAKTHLQQLPTGTNKETKNQPPLPMTSAHQTPQNSPAAAAKKSAARKYKNKQYWNAVIKSKAMQNSTKPPQKKYASNPIPSPGVGAALKTPVKSVASSSTALPGHLQNGAIPKQLKTQNQASAKKSSLSKPNALKNKNQNSTTPRQIQEFKTPKKNLTSFKPPKTPINTKSSSIIKTGAIPRHVGESPMVLNPCNLSDIADRDNLFTNFIKSSSTTNQIQPSLGSPHFHSLEKPSVQNTSSVEFQQYCDNSSVQNQSTSKSIATSVAAGFLSEPTFNHPISGRIAASFPSTCPINLGYPKLEARLKDSQGDTSGTIDSPTLEDSISSVWLGQHSVKKSLHDNPLYKSDYDANSVGSTTKSSSPPKGLTSFFKGVVGFLKKKAMKSKNQNEDDSSSKNTNKFTPSLFTDQRFAFKFNETVPQKLVLASSEDNTSCGTCGAKFELEGELMEHRTTDEHLFLEFYQRCSIGQSIQMTNKMPQALSGCSQGIQIQSAGGVEGSATLNVNLFLSDEDKAKGIVATRNIQLLVRYIPPCKNPKPLYLDRMFTIFNGSAAIHLLEENTSKQTVRQGKPIKRNLNVTGKKVEISECRVVFKFLQEDEAFKPDKPFFVMKTILVRYDNEATVEDGEPVASTPSVKPEPPELVLDFEEFITSFPVVVEEAEPPPRPKHQLKRVRRVKEYPLPISYAKFFNSGFQNNEISMEMLCKKLAVLEILVDGLTEDNYDSYMSLLLYLEEHQVLCDLRTYRMKNTPLFRDKQFRKLITITVPGLAENRPSVLKRDAIYITLPGAGVFKGWVHRVESSRILVGMGSAFMSRFIDKMKVTVDFSFNRNCLKLQHRAVEILMNRKQVPQICFPKTCGAYVKNYPIKSWVNPLVSKNPQQRQAVQNIMNGTSLPAPYLLFGPPGTGKTVTLVETIKQIFFHTTTSCILATAPSNSASDLLAERVLESVPRSEVLRLYSPSREWSMVPLLLQNSCNFYSEECCFPSLETLGKYRVIVATLICAGRLVTGGFPEGHFTHIFVDECGHGMETESLVPIAALLSPEPNPGQLVLSGDPKQLGPIIRSPVAKRLGLSQSLLERLMDSCALYQKQNGHYNPKVLTKLVKNFRSHPDILKVPNELFYEGDLEPCGEVGVTHSACQWEELPTKGVPLIFHGIEGKDAQDDCSPSFYNIAEVDLVVSYVQKILSAKFCGQKLRPADIGIISPYRRQIMKLHRALERKQLTGLSVGSVEEFQGQERRVIIVSTVRSDPAQLSLDRKFRLGFLREPKRFNVALTRAKSLLIVVGNPFTLQMDCNWHRLLEWVIERGGYRGCDFSLTTALHDGLGPIDPDELRVPVQQKLEQQLALARQALELQGGEKEMWRSHSDVNKMMNDIMGQIQLGFIPGVSELESVVSPPFSISER